MFNKVAIIGTGLIGGSMALAIKKHKLAKEIVGVCRHEKSLLAAKKIKAIDKGSLDIAIAKGADLIILAMPVKAILDIAPKVAEIISKEATVCDVGSTKEAIVSKLDRILPNFVGTHPMAGSEKRGVVNASGDLFKGSLCIITPSKNTKKASLAKIKSLWIKLGARIEYLSAFEHDKAVSLVSHLPHIAAFSLINSVPEDFFKFAATGLKDTTRIASSDAEVWSDIFLSNKKNILESIVLLKNNLKKIEEAVKASDRGKLSSILILAKNKREKLK